MRVLLTLICGLTILSGAARAESHAIKLSFEVEDKPSAEKLRIIFYLGKRAVEPKVSNGQFDLPKLTGHEKIGVRLLAGKFNLLFLDLYASKFADFRGELIFGVKRKPFRPEDIPDWQKPDQELIAINYLVFSPIDGDGSVITNYDYKPKKARR